MSIRQSKGKHMPEELLAELRRVAVEIGEQKLVGELGLNAATVARAVSGFEVYPGTMAAVRLFLNDRARAA